MVKAVTQCEECGGTGNKTYIFYVRGKKRVEEDVCWKCLGLGTVKREEAGKGE